MTDDPKTSALPDSLLHIGAALAVAAALPLLAACEGDSAVGPGASGNYHIDLARTGAASGSAQPSVSAEEAGIRAARLSQESVEAVRISLEAVEVYRLNSDTTGSDTTQSEDARWIRVEVVSDSASSDSAGGSSLVLDLTELPTDSSGIEVAAGDLEAGTYHGLRLRFSGAELVLADSARLGGGEGGETYGPGTYDLFVPSGVQTGIKLPSVRFTMTSDGSETTTVLADTEASIQNINITGRGFLMTPVLTTASEDSSAAEDSTSSGS